MHLLSFANMQHIRSLRWVPCVTNCRNMTIQIRLFYINKTASSNMNTTMISVFLVYGNVQASEWILVVFSHAFDILAHTWHLSLTQNCFHDYAGATFSPSWEWEYSDVGIKPSSCYFLNAWRPHSRYHLGVYIITVQAIILAADLLWCFVCFSYVYSLTRHTIRDSTCHPITLLRSATHLSDSR